MQTSEFEIEKDDEKAWDGYFIAVCQLKGTDDIPACACIADMMLAQRLVRFASQVSGEKIEKESIKRLEISPGGVS